MSRKRGNKKAVKNIFNQFDVRIKLKVEDTYKDNIWLGINNSEEELVVA